MQYYPPSPLHETVYHQVQSEMLKKKKIVQSELHQGWKFSGEFVYTPREENKKGGGVSLSHNLVHIKTDKIIVWSMKT